jgi:hypothetical protein
MISFLVLSCFPVLRGGGSPETPSFDNSVFDLSYFYAIVADFHTRVQRGSSPNQDIRF